MTLARVLGARVKAKGLNKFPYQLLLWVLLIGGELAGAVLGFLVHSVLESGEPVPRVFVYFCALVGGGLGVVIALVISDVGEPAGHPEAGGHHGTPAGAQGIHL